MRRPWLWMTAVFTLATIGAGTRAAAQEMVPKELALMRGASDGGDILVGTVPPDLARDLIPPAGGRVLGSFVSTSSVQVVMAVPGTLDSARAYARRLLTEHGWQPFEPIRPRMGGLQFTPPASASPTMYCRITAGQSESMTAYASFYGYATSLLRFTRMQGGMCDSNVHGERVTSVQLGSAVAVRPAFRSPFEALPPLYSPGDSRSMMSCRSSSSSGSASQGIQVRTPLSPGEVLSYYGRQLDSAGWKRQARQDSVAAVGAWSLGGGREQNGQEVTITVAPMPAKTGCYTVSLTATYDAR